MRIYNTLTGKKEEFIPIEEGKVRMYVCGPTVYNLIHIGNARPMIFFDTVRRYFTYRGYKVNYVSNYTDVDDKIIKAANEEGVESDVISERFIMECKKDAKGLNVLPATTHPKATEEIPEMIKMTKTLIVKGFAYESNGSVYYRIKAKDDYGKLSHKNIEDLESGHRDIKVTGEEEKENPLDFILWKPKKEGEPGWSSPWGEGRPGWHIECSCMAKKYLGDEIDIHGGGEDLVFPHHENEIAQSEGANGKPFARYWMHNAFLNIDNKKMSKSLGNFFTVRDISEKYDLNILRFFMLQAHYRSPLNFSDELMNSAKAGWERINNCYQSLIEKGAGDGRDTKTEIPVGGMYYDPEIMGFKNRFMEVMDDDFNTADAISVIFDLVKFINIGLSVEVGVDFIDESFDLLCELCGVLGISLIKPDEELDEEVEALIAERNAAKKNKNYALADEIRDELLSMGIELKDTREGVTWRRIQ